MSNARPAAVPTVQIDNDSVRVTEWRFAPGAETGWHRHEHEYVVIPVTNGLLQLETPDGPREAHLTLGRDQLQGRERAFDLLAQPVVGDHVLGALGHRGELFARDRVVNGDDLVPISIVDRGG